MKSKILIAFIAVLVFGLIFMGCPEDNKNGEKPDITGLKPWTPDPIGSPDTGFKVFNYDNYQTYAGEGGVGFVEEDPENPGTLKVEIKTNPGGVSLLAFNAENYAFKTGYYLALELPKDTVHKPIAAVTFAAVGPGENGSNWQSTPYRVNHNDNNELIDSGVYLAGNVEFFWNDPNFKRSVFRTLALYLHWGLDEMDGYYEFTIKQIKISDDPPEALVPPPYPNTAWTPAPVSEPAGYIAYTDADMLKSTFFAGEGVIPAGSITKNANGSFNVSIKTRPGAQSQVCFIADTLLFEAYYLSITIPDNPAFKPTRVYTWASTAKGDSGIIWAATTDTDNEIPDNTSQATYYVKGKVDAHWSTEEEQYVLRTVGLYFYWHENEEIGDFEFTVNTLKAFPYGGELPDPNDMTPYTPPAAAAPSGWVDFPSAKVLEPSYPSGAAITPNGSGGYTVSASVRGDGDHSRINITSDDFLFHQGWYLSMTFPSLTKNSPNKPSRVYINMQDKDGAPFWNVGVVDINRESNNQWIQGKVDCFFEHAALGASRDISINIYWHDGKVPDDPFEFIINSIMVKEKFTE